MNIVEKYFDRRLFKNLKPTDSIKILNGTPTQRYIKDNLDIGKSYEVLSIVKCTGRYKCSKKCTTFQHAITVNKPSETGELSKMCVCGYAIANSCGEDFIYSLNNEDCFNIYLDKEGWKKGINDKEQTITVPGISCDDRVSILPVPSSDLEVEEYFWVNINNIEVLDGKIRFSISKYHDIPCSITLKVNKL